MHRITALASAASLALATLVAAGSPSAASQTTAASATPVSASASAVAARSAGRDADPRVGARGYAVPSQSARKVKKSKTRLYRATTRPGQRDRSVHSIKHVRELQYRLRWAGVYKGKVDGVYGKKTKKAVKKFKKKHHKKHRLARNGVAGPGTWKVLIQKTVRAKKKIPKRCKSSGWNICYDRKRHQVMLYKGGKLWNSWLVRGGSSSTKTRTGKFSVFLRSKNHVSSLFEAKMPYAQFFSGGQAFHASYLMMDPFVGHSHGCVNMYIPDAQQLWALTANKKLKVTVYGAWS